ncbi:hypothetical protein ACIBEJ_24485 [Nonomuraea sp. NPDC050790]|uniref:hypothetical protein n=1 Tax=Nonomuraea sp. NPDC050790 TaxID=3364371 RepID=UPI00379E5E58
MKSFISGIVAVLALSACGSSSIRDETDWRSNHTDAQVGPVRLLHLNIEAPPMDQQQVGGELPLYLTIVNESDREQVLDAVSTTEAKKVVYVGGDAAPADRIRVTVPPKGETSMQKGDGRPYLRLVGVNRQLGHTTVPVTFRFPTAGSVTVRVPVAPAPKSS